MSEQKKISSDKFDEQIHKLREVLKYLSEIPFNPIVKGIILSLEAIIAMLDTVYENYFKDNNEK